MKIKCFEKWSKFQHGIEYWLGAVQATSHYLNQCWHSSSTHIYVSRCDWIEYYATLWSWWSYNNRNGFVVEVATRVVTGGAEACPQRLRWWLGWSSWRHIRFIDEIYIYIAKLGLDELGTVTEAIILATYTFQWLYRYCIRIYCILCFRNITVIVDLCAFLLLLLSISTLSFTYVF